MCAALVGGRQPALSAFKGWGDVTSSGQAHVPSRSNGLHKQEQGKLLESIGYGCLCLCGDQNGIACGFTKHALLLTAFICHALQEESGSPMMPQRLTQPAERCGRSQGVSAHSLLGHFVHILCKCFVSRLYAPEVRRNLSCQLAGERSTDALCHDCWQGHTTCLATTLPVCTCSGRVQLLRQQCELFRLCLITASLPICRMSQGCFLKTTCRLRLKKQSGIQMVGTRLLALLYSLGFRHVHASLQLSDCHHSDTSDSVSECLSC